jgi:hypothetical protein
MIDFQITDWLTFEALFYRLSSIPGTLTRENACTTFCNLHGVPDGILYSLATLSILLASSWSKIRSVSLSFMLMHSVATLFFFSFFFRILELLADSC